MKRTFSFKKCISVLFVFAMIIVGLLVARPVAEAAEDTKIDNCTEYASQYYDGEEYDTYRTYTETTDEKGVVTRSYPNYPKKEGYFFAGWYQGTEDGTAIDLEKSLGETAANSAEGAWAKFVPDEVLSVKSQLSTEVKEDRDKDGTSETYRHIRMVTSVDALKYSQIGFDFSINGGEVITRASNKVYTYLRAVGDTTGERINYYPWTTFCGLSIHFKTWTFKYVPTDAFDVQFAVTPFWVTSDGTKVCGEQSIRTVNQGLAYSDLRPFEAEYDYEYYETLEEAIEAANNETNGSEKATITLFKDVTIEDTIAIGGEGLTKCAELKITNSVKNGVVEEHTITKSADFVGTNMFTVASGYALAIEGADSKTKTGITVDGNSVDTDASMFSNTGTLSICNATVKNGKVQDASAGGGAITNTGTLTIDNAEFSKNQAIRTSTSYSAPAGAININGGAVTITNSSFKENSSTKDGGAIRNGSSVAIKIANCTFNSNAAGSVGTTTTSDGSTVTETAGENAQGGAIYMTGTSSFTEDSVNNTFIDNKAPLGGAVGYNSSTKSILTDWSFEENQAYQYISSTTGKAVAYGNGNGGAIYVSKTGKVEIADTSVIGNTAYSGGAIYVAYENTSYGSVTATNTIFDGNKTLGNAGGAIYNQGVLTATKCEFKNNIASDASGVINKNAGAIYVNVVGASATLTNTTFVNNQAKDGGAIRITNGTIIANGCTFENNKAVYTNSSANGCGGAINLSGNTTVTLNESGENSNTFIGNATDSNFGGAIYCGGGTLTVGKNTFKENSGTRGGAIYHADGTVNVSGYGNFADNTASTTGNDIAVAAGKTLSISDTTFDNGEISLVMSSSSSVGVANVAGELKGVTFRYYNPNNLTTSSTGITVSSTDIATTSDIKIIPYTYAVGTPVVFGSLTELTADERARFGATSVGDGKHFGVDEDGQLAYTPVAQIGETTYDTLQNALSAASSGDTITVLRDSEIHTARTDLSKNITIQNAADRTVTIHKYEGTLTNGTLIKAESGYKLTIQSNGDNQIIIDGRSAEEALKGTTASTTSGALLYTDGGTIELTNVIMRYSNSTGAGACIQVKNAGQAILNGCTFESNKTTGNGGVVNLVEGAASATVDNCTFVNNVAGACAGAINLETAASSATITGSTFKNNTGTKDGGAIRVLGTLNCTDCDFISNKTGNTSQNANGGAIYATANGKVYIKVSENGSSTFDSNTAYRVANNALNLQTYGAICANSSSYVEYSRKCIFTNNTDGDVTTTTDVNEGFALGVGVGRGANTSTIVQADEVASYETLKEAVNSASTVWQTKITLLSDITIGDTRIDVATSGNDVVITNASGTAVKVTRGSSSNSNLFAVGEDSSLSFVANTENSGSLTIDGTWTEQKSAMLYVKDGGVLALNGVTVTGGSAGDGAAVKAIQGTVDIDSCTITNHKSSNGGAISLNATGGEVNCTIDNTSFNGNTATYDGGVLYITGANKVICEINDSTFQGNTATRDGGAIYTNNSHNDTTTYLLGTVNFNTNSAKNGGAIYLSKGTLTTETTDEAVAVGVVNFTSNKIAFAQTTYGGAIYQGGGTISLLGGGKFENNTAGVVEVNACAGGAVNIASGTFNVTDYEFTGNSAVKDGGALRVDAGTANVTNCNFTNNSAGTPKEQTGGSSIYNGRGGAIYLTGGGKGVLNLLGTGTFEGNTYTHGDTGTVNNAIYNSKGTITGTELYTFADGQSIQP